MEKGLGTTCFENGKLQVVKDRQASRKLCFLDLLVNVASSLTKKLSKKVWICRCAYSVLFVNVASGSTLIKHYSF